ncbi:MAG: patatin-like phospholipase family protein [Bdellovibrionales bacterium]|nr:patatin-like phospholipase family protein [Bdellovibrionales bacterium]
MTPSNSRAGRLGLVLSAGGARAAYQVGVLRHLGKHLPELFCPTVFTGISAGSINAAYLAQGQPIPEATEKMYELWRDLKFEQVMKTNFRTMFAIFQKIFYDLFLSKVTQRKVFTSVLDASPLAETLSQHIHFPRITKAIHSGAIHGIAVSTTNYNTSINTVFYDSHDNVPPWARRRRIAIRTRLRLRHIMASCSLPIIFEPIKIGDYFYGDGALRFRFPLSPAIHLGATHILALGMVSNYTYSEAAPAQQKKLSMGLVAGTVLNSIFVDSLETDYENVQRFNELAAALPNYRKLEVVLFSPSRDLGHMAEDFVNDIPYHFRQLLKASAMSATELGDLISYLLFTKGYIQALIELGEKDAATRHDELEAFFRLVKAENELGHGT